MSPWPWRSPGLAGTLSSPMAYVSRKFNSFPFALHCISVFSAAVGLPTVLMYSCIGFWGIGFICEAGAELLLELGLLEGPLLDSLLRVLFTGFMLSGIRHRTSVLTPACLLAVRRPTRSPVRLADRNRRRDEQLREAELDSDACDVLPGAVQEQDPAGS